MLISGTNLSKTIGVRNLFNDVTITIDAGEKVALIGRNGYGKTTLLKILSGEDQEFEGKVITRKNLRTTLTKQEHVEDTSQSALEYILHNVHRYHECKKIIEEFEQDIRTDVDEYLAVHEFFTEMKYFNITSSILATLEDFNISNDKACLPLKHLSGGEKRYVEMTRMMFSQSELLLVDEPTNHMDYLGKERFITWMRTIPQAVVVVTHDRDVLRNVTKVIELKEQKIVSFNGNYDRYIQQNANQTLTSVKLYSDQLNRLKEAKKRVEWGLQMRAKSKEWKIRYDHWLRDYEKIEEQTVKPSFWIDQNSVEALDEKVVDSYHKFKQKNIKISPTTQKSRNGELIRVRNLSLGYTEPIFSGIHFSVGGTDRVFIKGRNGAGKSTLVRTLVALAEGKEPQATRFEGEIVMSNDIRIGEYEQEINERFLSLSLEDAVVLAYKERNINVDMQQVKKMLAHYLFNPTQDGKQKIKDLSGGQKARFQLIKMFIGEPNILILDEPTNHLDLPSIEELENALSTFAGGILYISHDTYFIDRMGGDVVTL